MADDRQNKIDQTMSSVTPARLEATRLEVEVERQKRSTPKPGSEEAPMSDATKRMEKLDLIQDVQLILIDKYRTGTLIMMGAVGLMTLCLLGLGGLIAKNYELHDRIAALQDEQHKLIERGEQIEKKTDATKQTIDETKQTIDETKEKVDQAVDEAPKIEIDEAGKAKVVVPVRKFRKSKKGMVAPAPSASSTASAVPAATHSAATLPMQIPLETKGF